MKMDQNTIMMFVMLGLAALIAIPAGVVYMSRFDCKRQYIISEIKRTEGEEREHWRRELKKHYRSLFGFLNFHN